MMKKVKFLVFLLAGAFIFQSCDNDDESYNQADLIGIWSVSNVDLEILVNDMDMVDYYISQGSTKDEAEFLQSLYELLASSAFTGSTIEFKSDNTYEVKQSGSELANGTWALNSNATQILIDAGTADEDTYEIASLSNNSLIIKTTESEMDDLNEDGTDEEVTTNIDLSLTK